MPTGHGIKIRLAHEKPRLREAACLSGVIDMSGAQDIDLDLRQLDLYYSQLREQRLVQTETRRFVLADHRWRQSGIPQHQLLPVPDEITAIRQGFLSSGIGEG